MEISIRRENIPKRMVDFVRKYSTTTILAEFFEKTADLVREENEALYRNLCNDVNGEISKAISTAIPVSEEQWDMPEKAVVIRVYNGKICGYYIVGSQVYIRRKKKYLGGLIKRKYFLTARDDREIVAFDKIPEFRETFCGVCGDVETLTEENAEVKYFYYKY